MIGQTISHYQILAKLGEGGMGVVYRAHDSALDRDVALKFLPRDVALSEDERARFIHEAKAASALEHPGICTIHEIGETSDGQLFIVMGYYEGESISRKVERGRLPVAEAVGIAIQVAEGLQAAHEKHIVHRDIKSGNIVVTERGQAKILDFGLARKGGLSKLTRTATTVGTAAYMSPEQARGEEVDERTDLWSLGVVLYEMVTGKLPFRGDHEAAILYSVVNEEPQPIETSVPDASPELIHVIQRALEKEKGERYQAAADMLIDLRRLKRETSRTGFAPARIVRRKHALRTGMVAAAGIAILCTIGYFLYYPKGMEINVNFSQRRIEVPFGAGIDAALSPDGKWIVFTAPDRNHKVDLYALSSSGGAPERLTNDSTRPTPPYGQRGNSNPRVSPDGRSVAYSRYTENLRSELCIVPLVGGRAKTIDQGVSACWSPDGKRIGYVKSPGFSDSKKAEFWTIRADGKERRREFVDTVGIISAPGNNTLEVFLFDWSPDGNAIAWIRRLPQLYCELVVHDVATGVESKLTTDTTLKLGVCWLPNNTIIYSSSGDDGIHLRAMPLGGGVPVQITRGSGGETMPTASLDGSALLYVTGTTTAGIGVGRLDGSEPSLVASIRSTYEGWTDPSPTNKQIVFNPGRPGLTSYSLSVINYDGSNERALTKGGEQVDIAPRWSPNGSLIAFMSRKTFEPYDSFKTYVINPKTMEEPRLVSRELPAFGEWLSDSTILVANITGTKWFCAYLDGTPPVQLAADSILPNFVADGKYVLYTDIRKSPQASTWWIVPIVRWSREGGKDPEIFDWVRSSPPGWIYGGAVGRYRFTLWCDTSKGDLWTISFPDRRKTQILHSCALLRGIRSMSLSWDETEYSFARPAIWKEEINVIEGFFK